MKLKKNILIHKIDDTLFLVPVGAEAFSGIIRNNKTAGFIVNLLRTETTEEEIIAEMCARFDASGDKIAADVREVLATLRSIHVLEE